MQRMLKLFMCCALVALLAVSAGAQDQPKKKKGQGKKKANAAQNAKKAQTPRPPKQLTPEQIAQMEQAMPKEAAAKPQKPRKVLIFSLTKGFPHDSVPVGAKALEMMGQKTGAWEATISTDLDMFLPENLNKFDAVIMNNTTGRYFFYPPTVTDKTYNTLTPEQKKEGEEYAKKRQDALVAFVKGGKGLVGVHSACDCEYETWPEYGDMMGAYFAGHPWHCVVPFKIDLPDHVINKPFNGQGFSLNDEMYVFKDQPYSREKLLVLVSLDTPKLPKSNTGSNVTRPDGDYAVSWVHKYGEGRVFYCSLGHEWAIFWTPAVLEHYLRGIQYALGDLQAPDDPKLNKK